MSDSRASVRDGDGGDADQAADVRVEAEAAADGDVSTGKAAGATGGDEDHQVLRGSVRT